MSFINVNDGDHADATLLLEIFVIIRVVDINAIDCCQNVVKSLLILDKGTAANGS